MQRSNGTRPVFESSLELKCLFFFGVALFFVITMSFWLYWSVTEALILSQNLPMARSAAKTHWLLEHVRKLDAPQQPGFDHGPPVPGSGGGFSGAGSGDPAMSNDIRDILTQMMVNKDNSGKGGEPKTRAIRSPQFGGKRNANQQPQNEFEKGLLDEYRTAPLPVTAATLDNPGMIPPAESAKTRPNDSPPFPEPKIADSGAIVPKENLSLYNDPVATPRQYYKVRTDDEGRFHYYEPYWAEPGCLLCHRTFSPEMNQGDLIGIIEVTIADPPSKKVATEYWVWLLVASIVTAALAMLAFYLIIRWIIIKPLRHLREVSDAISRGDISQRADLHTGDEFEALALAFNRTLRQILNTQEKLRGINTELDQRVDQLARLNVQLYESNRVKSDFMATMSHELRTPLNSIIGFSEVLGSIASLDDKQKRYVENISKSGKTLLEMINNILDMTKIDSGRIEIHLSTFPPASVVAAQCDMAKPLVDRKNIDLVCDIPANLPPMHQDPMRLQQILNNLLSNAIKFTPEGGRIKVQLRRLLPEANTQETVAIELEKQHRAVFARQHAASPLPVLQGKIQGNSIREPMLEMKVVDTGVGISEEDQQVIFEKFRQGKSLMTEGDTMKREYSGSGLGLSIVKELCRLLGGTVTVESQLGFGSTFTVSLPWLLEPQTRIESEIMADIQEFSKNKPGTKRLKP